MRYLKLFIRRNKNPLLYQKKKKICHSGLMTDYIQP
jgi:hypothetical protein